MHLCRYIGRQYVNRKPTINPPLSFSSCLPIRSYHDIFVNVSEHHQVPLLCSVTSSLNLWMQFFLERVYTDGLYVIMGRMCRLALQQGER